MMSRSVKVALLVVIAAIVLPLSSCKEKHTTEPSGDAGVIMPLKEGNTWTIQDTFYDEQGNITSTGVESKQIGRDTVIDGETWYRTPYLSIYHYTNRADGCYLRVQDNGASAQITRLMPFPAHANDSISAGSTYLVVASVSDQITVAAGTFTCYQYRWNYNSSPGQPSPGYRQEWYCPNVGPVKFQSHRRATSGQYYIDYTGELSSYHLN